MRHLLLLLLLLNSFYCFEIHGQSKFEPGQIITINQDTVNGYILNGIDPDLVRNIHFKKNNTDPEATSYSTENLLGFSFENGRTFMRIKVARGERPQQDSVFVFAKRMVKGKLDLYKWSFPNNSSTEFFVRNNSTANSVKLQKPKKFEMRSNGRAYSGKDKIYQQQLMNLKVGTIANAREDKDLKFTEKSILNDVVSYNAEFKKEYPVKVYKEPKEYQYDVLIGLSPNNIDSPGGYTVRAALYRSKFYADNPKRFSFMMGVAYAYSSSDPNEEISNPYSRYPIKRRFIDLWPAVVKYQARKGVLRPYAFLGLGVQFRKEVYYVTENYERQEDYSWNSTLIDFKTGVGIKIKWGSDFIIAELYPTYYNTFFSIGYSF